LNFGDLHKGLLCERISAKHPTLVEHNPYELYRFRATESANQILEPLSQVIEMHLRHATQHHAERSFTQSCILRSVKCVGNSGLDFKGAEGRCLPGLTGWIAGSRTPASHRVTDQGAHGFDRCHYRLSPAA